MKISSLSATGKITTVTVSDDLFGQPINKQVLSQAIRVYLSNLRQGTSKVKTRGEINLTKKKWFRQKGTGNARHGAKSAPIFVGGGVAHGPKGVENWRKSLTKTLKHKALISSLSAQAQNFVLADSVMTLEGKTKAAWQLINQIAPDDQRVLVILPERNVIVERSLRNLPNVLVRIAQNVNALEVSSADKIVSTKAALSVLEARLNLENKTKQA